MSGIAGMIRVEYPKSFVASAEDVKYGRALTGEGN